MLYIFGGLPGSGKSTLSLALARQCNAVYLRIDTIEQALREAGYCADNPAGYFVGYRLATENLRLGWNVVADSVNPLDITRCAWRNAAASAQADCVEIEIICSDPNEHRRRIETRSTDVVGLKLPNWNDVIRREYDAWTSDHIVLDTAGQTPDESLQFLLHRLKILTITIL